MIAKIMNIVPEWMKIKLLRAMVSTKNVYKDQDVKVKLAETTEEYKKAFELLHDCYVNKNLMEKHESGMRCSIHSFLPHNVVVIATTAEGQVIGTVSIIRDNPLYVPAESIYKDEVNLLRSLPHRELVEISALSIAPEFRKRSHTILFLLNKFLYLYSRDYFKANTLIITIHPRSAYFYKALFNFKQKGKIISYQYVKGALATLMYMDFSGNHEENMWKNVFKGRKDSLIDYILYQNDPRLTFPEQREDNVKMNNKKIMLELIKLSKFDINSLNEMEFSYLISSLNLNEDDFKALGIQNKRLATEYRFQKKISARIKFDDLEMITKIINISAGGAFIELPVEYLDSIQEGEIQFNWKGEKFISKFKVKWINKGISKKLPYGIGVELASLAVNLFDEDLNYERIYKASS